MTLACYGMGRLLERRASGLSSAEGLMLEEHLATCQPCRAQANLLHGLTQLASDHPPKLDETARERAIAKAFTAGASTHALRELQRPRPGVLLLAAAGALAATILLALRETYPSDSQASHATSPERSEPSARVLSGQVEVAGSTRTEGERLAEQTLLHSPHGALLALGHARVELRADSDAVWDGRARKLWLERGSALIDVDPGRQLKFEVETQAFTVSVLGTRFEVTESSVHVSRGRVAVHNKRSGPDTPSVVLSGGSDHADFELQPTAAALSAIDVAAPKAADGPQPRTTKPRGAATQPSEPAPSALLDRARAQLAARELAQARTTLELALPKLSDGALRAQALSLQAECDLLERRFQPARDKYLRVAQQFPELPAAETALFAAARIEADHGPKPHARELLQRYLVRYPQGSFVREAERRLRTLAEPEP